MQRLLLLLILLNCYPLFAIVPLFESLALPKQLILPYHNPSIHNPLYHLSTFDTLNYAFNYHDDNILYTSTSHIQSTSYSHELFLKIERLGTIYGGLSSYSASLDYTKLDTDTLSLTHYNHQKHMGLYLQGYTPFIGKFEYQSNGTVTAGLGIADHLLIEGSYHSELKEDSLHLWNKAFRINGYPAIHGIYRALNEEITLKAHGAYQRHFLSTFYSEALSKPSQDNISESSTDQSHYWLADSSSSHSYGATYHYTPLSSDTRYRGSFTRKKGTTTTMGFRQNATDSFGTNTKKYHHADFSHDVIDTRLSVTLSSTGFIDSFTFGGSYLSYNIATNNTDRGNRLNDFLRYNTLFPSQLSTILVSSYFNQSDFVTSSLSIKQYTLPLSITHSSGYGIAALSTPFSFHTLDGSLTRETYTIPTFFLSSPILNNATTFTLTGTFLTIPLQVSYAYKLGTVTLSITVNQIIPVWNSIEVLDPQQDNSSQPLTVSNSDYSITKNGFSAAYSAKISF